MRTRENDKVYNTLLLSFCFDAVYNRIRNHLELTLEIFEKVCNGRSVLPLVNQKKFVLLFNEEEESMKFTLKDRKKVKAKKASPKKSPKPSEKTSC